MSACDCCGTGRAGRAIRHVVAEHRRSGERRVLVLCRGCAENPSATWCLQWSAAVALEELEKPKAKERQGERTDLKPSVPGSQKLRDRNRVRETVGQCAMASLKLLDYEKERAKERMAEGGRKSAPGHPTERSPQKGTPLASDREERRKAVNEAGARLGVSGKSVERAQRVAAEDWGAAA